MKLSILPVLFFITVSTGCQALIQPQDVRAFVKDADKCQHIAAEWDSGLPEDRLKALEKSSAEICPKATEQQERLREKYHDNKPMLDVINQYDF